MIVEPFRPEHAAELEGDPGLLEYARRHAEASEYACTIRIGGKPLVCAGVAEMGDDKALVWAYVAPVAADHPIAIHRAALRFIGTLNYRRLEATCKANFARGCKWLESLGFVCEGTMRSWGPDGSDYNLYALVRP